MSKSDSPEPATAWAPLKIPVYRAFWIAGLVSNLGTWAHETGAVWLMTSLQPHPEMVSAVRTCMTIPLFCLALPAGVWADRFDRRSWLLATQSLLLITAGLMTILSAWQLLDATWLLVFTVMMGIGVILNQPAWQALTPELVPISLVPSAVSIGSVSFNLARAAGPALAGLLMAQFDIWVAFAFNTLSFLAVIGVLVSWKPETEVTRRRSQLSFYDELRKGWFVIRNSVEIRNTLLRISVFAIPASILWALLSLVATEKLGYEERGYGFCLGLIGLGAVLGAIWMPYWRSRWSSEAIVLTAQCSFAAICIVIGLTSSAWIILPVLLIVGTGWMATMTTFNATAQVYLPRKFRARGMATFMMCFALGMGGGSLLWGWLARWSSISTAFVVAGIVMALIATSVHRLPIGSLQVAADS